MPFLVMVFSTEGWLSLLNLSLAEAPCFFFVIVVVIFVLCKEGNTI